MWGTNDYPYAGRCPRACNQECAGQCGGSEACCQCASFACWRIANDLHTHLGAGYGNANTWAAASIANHIPTDHTPRVHSIVCLPNVSASGHVAAVLAVGPATAYGHVVPSGYVLVEDYNWGFCCCYQIHTLPVASSGVNETWFIHFATTTPPTCPSCPACEHCTDPAVGCVQIPCGPCEVCANGICFTTCAAGSECLNGVCTGGVGPPPPPPSTALAVGGALLLGLAGLGLWEAHAHPRTSRAVFDRLEGGGPALGPGGRPVRVARRPRRGAPPPTAFSRLEGGAPALGQGRTRANLEQTAVETFGTTPFLRNASFVLPDGTLLAWPGATNPIRTRESSSHHSDISRRLLGGEKYGDLQPLLDRGWLRVQNFRDLLVTQVGQQITPAQARRLRDGTEPFGRVVIDAEIGTFEQPRCEAAPPTPSAINACVRTVNEGIVAGRVRRDEIRERARQRGLLPLGER